MKTERIIKILLFIVLWLCMISCQKEAIVPKGDQIESEENRWGFNGNIIYYANSHNSNYTGTVAIMNQWANTITFMSGCVYTAIDPDNQADWNKLFGIKKSIYPWNNGKNGAYLAWSCEWYLLNGVSAPRIRVSWYLHDKNGNFICPNQNQGIIANIGQAIYVRITNYGDHFNIQIGTTLYLLDKGLYNIDDFNNGNRLNCWFGGDEVAPHQMVIHSEL